MMRSRLVGRLALGVAVAGFALAPIAIPAGAGDDSIDYKVDPPDDLSDFTPGEVLSDEQAAALAAAIDPGAFIAIVSAGLADADDDGIPDIPEGERGDLDKPPGDALITIDPATGAVTLADGATVDASVDTVGGGGSFLQGQCGGAAVSYAGDGEVLDSAIGIGSSGDGLLLDTFGSGSGSRAFTESNPFEVQADGKVLYFGFMPYTGGDGPRNHIWEITTAGISLDSGGDDNPEGNNANAGVVDLGDNIPAAARFTGVFPMQGWMFSENGLFCIGEGWVEFTGPFPLFTTAGAIGSVFALGGIAGLLFNSRPAITFKV